MTQKRNPVHVVRNRDRSEPDSTKLSASEYERVLRMVVDALKAGAPYITNTLVRNLAGIGYDQAIAFFKRAVSENKLLRNGRGSRTHYVLPASGAGDGA